MANTNGAGLPEHCEIPHIDFQVIRPPLGNSKREFTIVNSNHSPIDSFLTRAFYPYKVKIEKAINEFGLILTNAHFFTEQCTYDYDCFIEDSREVHIETEKFRLIPSSDLREHFEENISEYLMREVEKQKLNRYDFVLNSSMRLRVIIYYFQPHTRCSSV